MKSALSIFIIGASAIAINKDSANATVPAAPVVATPAAPAAPKDASPAKGEDASKTIVYKIDNNENGFNNGTKLEDSETRERRRENHKYYNDKFPINHDTDRFVEDYIEAKSGKKVGESKLNQVSSYEPFQFPQSNSDAEKFTRDYKVAKSLQSQWSRMSREEQANMKAKFEAGPPLVNEVQLGFIDMQANQLTWDEHQNDKLVKDESEWHDVDFEFTKTHPDWGMDDNVKSYFAEAQNRRVIPKMKFDDDTDRFTNQYKLINEKSRKGYAIQNNSTRYDNHPSDQVQAKASNATSAANSTAPAAKAGPPELGGKA